MVLSSWLPACSPLRGRLWLSGSLLLASLLLFPAPIRSDDIATFGVIVHAGTDIGELSVERLRSIYRGDQQYWRDGTKIVVLIHRAGTRERSAVLAKILEMTEEDYKEFWITRIFRGEVMSGPKVVTDSRALIELVRTIPGAIGVIRTDDIPDAADGVAVAGELSDSGGPALR